MQSARCITCWDENAVPGSKQCNRCQGYPDGDPDRIPYGDDLTPMLIDILDRLNEMAEPT